MTHDANRSKFFTLFLCKIFYPKSAYGKIIITFLNGISRYAFSGGFLSFTLGDARWREDNQIWLDELFWIQLEKLPMNFLKSKESFSFSNNYFSTLNWFEKKTQMTF